VRFGTGGARDRFRNSLTRTPDGRLVYNNPRGPLQLITQEHVRRQPKEELGWRLPEDTSWEVRAGLSRLFGLPISHGVPAIVRRLRTSCHVDWEEFAL